jgi:hypothetical protein
LRISWISCEGSITVLSSLRESRGGEWLSVGLGEGAVTIKGVVVAALQEVGEVDGEVDIVFIPFIFDILFRNGIFLINFKKVKKFLADPGKL